METRPLVELLHDGSQFHSVERLTRTIFFLFLNIHFVGYGLVCLLLSVLLSSISLSFLFTFEVITMVYDELDQRVCILAIHRKMKQYCQHQNWRPTTLFVTDSSQISFEKINLKVWSHHRSSSFIVRLITGCPFENQVYVNLCWTIIRDFCIRGSFMLHGRSN